MSFASEDVVSANPNIIFTNVETKLSYRFADPYLSAEIVGEVRARQTSGKAVSYKAVDLVASKLQIELEEATAEEEAKGAGGHEEGRKPE